MIYITGDIHGEVDIHRLNNRLFPEQRNMDKSDCLIICGDFGCVWAGDQTDAYWLDWLEEKPFTTLFVDGNHENFPLLETYPRRIWQGGSVHVIRPSVLHLMRGQIFTLQGRRFFTMGGASSHDRAFRVAGKSWWPEELPNDSEMALALKNLEDAGWQVDYVITHCAPDIVQHAINATFASDQVLRGGSLGSKLTLAIRN